MTDLDGFELRRRLERALRTADELYLQLHTLRDELDGRINE